MFEKNLNAIDNEALKRRLRKISDFESREGISYCVTKSNDYILLKDEFPLDDLNNPREAIKSMFKKTIKHEMYSNDYIIAFGIGLGYLLDEAFNTYPSKIYVYEPDLKLLHFVLSNADISEHLASGRVYISNDLDEFILKLRETFITKDKVEIVYLPNYAVIKNKEILLLTQRVYEACKSKMIDVNTIKKFARWWLVNEVNNIATINEKDVYKFSDLVGKFSGQTAMVLAAGPSLKDNLEKIKANREKFVIFAVNKVLAQIVSEGIIPDFLVCLDAYQIEKTIQGLDQYFPQMNCIMDVRASSIILEKGFKKVFVNFAESDFLMKKLAKYNDFMKFYEGGGTAATLALVSAVKMGFSKVVFAGLDLAFKDNVIYSNGETMTRVSQEQLLVDSAKKNLVQVKSVNGDYVYTRDDYESFIQHFNMLIKELDYSELYNLTTFGAYIEGMKKADFNDILPASQASLKQLDFVEPFKFEVKEMLQEEFFHINNIIANLSKGTFSPALVASIIKSTLVYQYMQKEILLVMQKNFSQDLAEYFIERTKKVIKYIVDLLQKRHLI